MFIIASFISGRVRLKANINNGIVFDFVLLFQLSSVVVFFQS